MRGILVLGVLISTLGVAFTPLAVAAEGESIRLEIASGFWRGHTGDEVRVVYKARGIRRTIQGTIARYADGWLELTGESGSRLAPVFVSDIQSIEQLNGGGEVTESDADETSKDLAADSEADVTQETDADNSPKVAQAVEEDESIKPTFLLPMTGMVGLEFRPEEIEAIIAQADELGPGQTIVLEIDSGGGYVAEWEMIRDAIYEGQKRHRFVAWVIDGTSAACSTTLCCDVIVFTSRGYIGSITTLMGNPSAPVDYQVASARRFLEPVLRRFGRSPKLAVPFKTGDAGSLSLLSYSKDPETGKVTWYQSLEGDVDLNRAGDVLGFTAREAIDSGLAIGPADTEEELGVLIGQNGWKEVGTGRKLHEDWNAIVKRGQKELQLSSIEFQETGNDLAGLTKKIKIVESWLRWYKNHSNIPMNSGIPPKKNLEQLLIQLKDQRRVLQQR
ncbi:MAG: hypothetical protein MK100_09280 [Phycisphaerales bacterium]|nr:hypothetical protein [Phycisphaerales bacterium]